MLKDTKLDSSAVMIRADQGFEKRYLHRCPRCDIVVGYQLDLELFEDMKGGKGRREDVVYLLPGAVVETEEMIGADGTRGAQDGAAAVA